MSLSDDLKNDIKNQIDLVWSITLSTRVPISDQIVLRDGGVKIDATYVYADLANSSSLAQTMKKEVTASIIRAYLAVATRTLKSYGGEVRSFDGDRVMAIFVGQNKETNAVRAALAINWAVHKILKEKVSNRWDDISKLWDLDHGIGIDTGEAMLVRAGVRADNDIISIGSAPNVAAKLSGLRDHNTITITRAVYDAMSNEVAFTSNQEGKKVNMWQTYDNKVVVGNYYFEILSSNYYWKP